MLVVLLALLTCLLATQAVDGLQCFECSNERTVSTTHCVDPTVGAVPCEGQMCFKRTTINGDKTVVTRGCIKDNGGGDRCIHTTWLQLPTEYCVCVTESCNGATTTKTALVVVGILATAAVMLAYY